MRLLGLQAVVVVAYVAAAVVGFRLAFAAEQITTVWAPTGIALAALLAGGVRLWPAIWAGALLANVGTSAPFWTAIVIATGNTLESVTAVWWLRKLPDFDFTLRRIADVLAFVLIAALTCTTISATVGVATLCAGGVQPWRLFPTLWFDWWLGDALGALVVAPAILTAVRHRWMGRESLRASLWVGTALLATHIVFGQRFGAIPHPLEYVAFPLVIGAALNGGPPMTSLVVLIVSTVAIWHTVHGSGPFASAEVHYSLILAQVFMGVLAGTSLLLAAAIAERLATERRERDAAMTLRHREEMLRLAQRAGGVATFEWDFRSQVSRCSAEFFRIFGLPAEDGAMTSAEWGRFVHQDDRERLAAHLAAAVEGTVPAAADYRINAADGNTRWLTYAGQIQKTREGDRMLGIVVDITHRKRTEAELREHATEVERANQVKDQFLATLSHELRTPLNAILGYARMLQIGAVAPDKRQHAIDVIERNAVAQHQLVEDLLDMSRITTGKIRLAPEPVPVVTVLGEAVEGVKPAADAKGIVLEADYDPFAGTVRADPNRLQQVFWNLLTNAVKFTDEGGRVVTSLHREGAHVAITISDTGAGISREFLPFVFEPFLQAESRMDRAHGGLGLGLAITKQLVELHGGTIHASSPGRGRGATFIVRLPSVTG
jgi:PAS domain S-box-containing protein